VNTINRAFIGTAGLAIAAMMFVMPVTGTLAAPSETPSTGFETTTPIYTFPANGYETANPVYTFPSTGYETANPIYTLPAPDSVPSSIVV
jgi:hypothetical protein